MEITSPIKDRRVKNPHNKTSKRLLIDLKNGRYFGDNIPTISQYNAIKKNTKIITKYISTLDAIIATEYVIYITI
ncbi:MAG: hypothetical protein ACI9CD_000093 [Candidatus Deianiraeaceae bacterium]|jgi:hypothetical protein